MEALLLLLDHSSTAVVAAVLGVLTNLSVNTNARRRLLNIGGTEKLIRSVGRWLDLDVGLVLEEREDNEEEEEYDMAASFANFALMLPEGQGDDGCQSILEDEVRREGNGTPAGDILPAETEKTMFTSSGFCNDRFTECGRDQFRSVHTGPIPVTQEGFCNTLQRSGDRVGGIGHGTFTHRMEEPARGEAASHSYACADSDDDPFNNKHIPHEACRLSGWKFGQHTWGGITNNRTHCDNEIGSERYGTNDDGNGAGGGGGGGGDGGGSHDDDDENVLERSDAKMGETLEVSATNGSGQDRKTSDDQEKEKRGQISVLGGQHSNVIFRQDNVQTLRMETCMSADESNPSRGHLLRNHRGEANGKSTRVTERSCSVSKQACNNSEHPERDGNRKNKSNRNRAPKFATSGNEHHVGASEQLKNCRLSTYNGGKQAQVLAGDQGITHLGIDKMSGRSPGVAIQSKTSPHRKGNSGGKEGSCHVQRKAGEGQHYKTLHERHFRPQRTAAECNSTGDGLNGQTSRELTDENAKESDGQRDRGTCVTDYGSMLGGTADHHRHHKDHRCDNVDVSRKVRGKDRDLRERGLIRVSTSVKPATNVVGHHVLTRSDSMKRSRQTPSGIQTPSMSMCLENSTRERHTSAKWHENEVSNHHGRWLNGTKQSADGPLKQEACMWYWRGRTCLWSLAAAACKVLYNVFAQGGSRGSSCLAGNPTMEGLKNTEQDSEGTAKLGNLVILGGKEASSSPTSFDLSACESLTSYQESKINSLQNKEVRVLVELLTCAMRYIQQVGREDTVPRLPTATSDSFGGTEPGTAANREADEDGKCQIIIQRPDFHSAAESRSSKECPLIQKQPQEVASSMENPASVSFASHTNADQGNINQSYAPFCTLQSTNSLSESRRQRRNCPEGSIEQDSLATNAQLNQMMVEPESFLVDDVQLQPKPVQKADCGILKQHSTKACKAWQARAVRDPVMENHCEGFPNLNAPAMELFPPTPPPPPPPLTMTSERRAGTKHVPHSSNDSDRTQKSLHKPLWFEPCGSIDKDRVSRRSGAAYGHGSYQLNHRNEDIQNAPPLPSATVFSRNRNRFA
ncbi:hypothetical protein CBR_g31131 [Chara braunii]|uniref:Uncharacterized protein n=1 Tax=Chara braunii TaxID=69332 RepID=A0A388LEE4_CHABU|nr:hypothetical protein CBR_g31131 [Chara braunii]|eukprot:GBG80671.1 hypothetical protein CBR_g31131 [Chara braunii]